jgi:predicted RNA-binding protein with PIN domain
MPYLVDGHNLVPHVPGLSLSALDDERRLIDLLRTFARRTRRKVTVYFDRAAPGGAPAASGSPVTARFVSSPDTADRAIQRHLKRLGREARNWTVVSSDNEVRQAARIAGARSQTSQDFARLLLEGPVSTSPEEKPDPPFGQDELEKWASLFKQAGRRRPRGRD